MARAPVRRARRRQRQPKTEIVHTNISTANTYRLELAKTMLAISAALFAFTISFPPALTRIDNVAILIWGWVGLGVSTIGGLLNLYGWEKFYISYRDYHDAYKAGQLYRKWLTHARRAAHFAQMSGMIIGIAALAWFLIVNGANIKLAAKNEVVGSSTGATASSQATQGN